jgi:crotonobetainyl-CoA:carnitine CoA-transferase CaiB-like acyl-CoA transferase
MTQVMSGVRILEVAQFTFVPAAGGLLADWGAEVIKIEHPVRGDLQRGFLNLGGMKINPLRNPMMEHPNRGKRSVGIDIATPEGLELIYDIARTADVFLTNYLPSARTRLKIDAADIRKVNPQIIYARGSAYGDKGPERDVGGFDNTAFWMRTGIGYSMTPAELDGVLMQGIPAFGDSIGAMNIAGGIAAALFHRERTGEHRMVGSRMRHRHGPREQDLGTGAHAEVRQLGRQSFHRQLQGLGRQCDRSQHGHTRPVHPGHVQASRHSRMRRRPALLHGRGTHEELGGRERGDPRCHCQ